jgi:putative ABC transport system permease protein
MSIFQDIRLAFRLLRRSPMAAIIAVFSIALSVGATAVVFAAVKSVLLDPLPYARAGELVQLRSEFPGMPVQSAGDFVFWNDAQEVMRRNRTLASLGVYRNAVFDLAGDAGSTPEALYGLKVSASLFPTLGVAPMLGRNIAIEEDQPGHPEEMILSYGLWTRRFNSDPDVVGKRATVNGQPCEIIGVMPPGFNFPLIRGAAHTPSPYVEFWSPLSNTPGARNGAQGVVARLRSGVTIAQARQDLAGISSALSRELPATNRDKVLTLNFLRDRTVGVATNGLALLMGAALLFMLIGCANVANLLLARGFARQREISIRLAIGAGQARILRQLLTESCVLAVLGGAGGYLITVLAWQLLPVIAPVSIPRLAAARADGSIFGFALELAVLDGVLFGIAPALRLARARYSVGLSGFSVRGAASGRRDGTRSALVVAEVAVSVLLAVIGGQLLGSFVRLMNTDPGFEAGHVLASIVLPSPARYPKPEQRALFYRRILDAVRSLPGVESAGTVDALPFSGENHGGFISGVAAPSPHDQLTAEVDIVGGEYLQSMGVRLLDGRWFRDADMDDSSDTALINDFAAQRLWPGESPIGRRICLYCPPEHPDNWKRVIGVVSSVHHISLSEAPMANVYTAAGAMRESDFVVARTAHPTAELEQEIRRAVAAIDPQQPVFQSAPLRAFVADSVADRRFVMTLLAVTAALALVLSAAGVYGVVSYTTARRTQEIGIRMALGATPGDVNSLVFRQGFATALIGLALGLFAVVPIAHALRSTLPGLDALNPLFLSLAAGLVLASSAIACWIPARRATKIDPMTALAQE